MGLDMEKSIKLVEKINDLQDQQLAVIQAEVKGDGSTPSPMIAMVGSAGIIGFRDNGTPIVDPTVDQIINEAKKKFMAEAIREAKKLCIENGVDPELVNIINAEKKVNNE